MLGLPESTLLNRQIPKKAIFDKFGFDTSEREKFDRDISRIVLTNEISRATLPQLPDDTGSPFFVMRVVLKQPDYNESNPARLAALLGQRLLIVLEYGGESRLCFFHHKLYCSRWHQTEHFSLSLSGAGLSHSWNRVAASILEETEGFKWDTGYSFEENIHRFECLKQNTKEILRLEKQIRTEKQPARKLELYKELRKLKSDARD